MGIRSAGQGIGWGRIADIIEGGFSKTLLRGRGPAKG
jgi:hypothetical protein